MKKDHRDDDLKIGSNLYLKKNLFIYGNESEIKKEIILEEKNFKLNPKHIRRITSHFWNSETNQNHFQENVFLNKIPIVLGTSKPVNWAREVIASIAFSKINPTIFLSIMGNGTFRDIQNYENMSLEFIFNKKDVKFFDVLKTKNHIIEKKIELIKKKYDVYKKQVIDFANSIFNQKSLKEIRSKPKNEKKLDIFYDYIRNNPQLTELKKELNFLKKIKNNYEDIPINKLISPNKKQIEVFLSNLNLDPNNEIHERLKVIYQKAELLCRGFSFSDFQYVIKQLMSDYICLLINHNQPPLSYPFDEIFYKYIPPLIRNSISEKFNEIKKRESNKYHENYVLSYFCYNCLKYRKIGYDNGNLYMSCQHSVPKIDKVLKEGGSPSGYLIMYLLNSKSFPFFNTLRCSTRGGYFQTKEISNISNLKPRYIIRSRLHYYFANQQDHRKSPSTLSLLLYLSNVYSSTEQELKKTRIFEKLVKNIGIGEKGYIDVVLHPDEIIIEKGNLEELFRRDEKISFKSH